MTEGVAQMDRGELSALSATFKLTAGPATPEGGRGMWSFGEIQVAILSQRSWAQELTGSSLCLLPSTRRSPGESKEVENALHPSNRSTTIFFFFFNISRVLFAKEQNIVQTDQYPTSPSPETICSQEQVSTKPKAISGLTPYYSAYRASHSFKGGSWDRKSEE